MTTLTHRLRQSLTVHEHIFSLTDDKLVIDTDGKVEQIPYRDITKIRLMTYVLDGTKRGQISIFRSPGKNITVRSHHYTGTGDDDNHENRCDTYAPFATQLIAHTASANPHARFVAGSKLYWTLWLVLLAFLVVLTFLLSLIVISGEGDVIVGLALMLAIVPIAWKQFNGSRQSEFAADQPPMDMLRF